MVQLRLLCSTTLYLNAGTSASLESTLEVIQNFSLQISAFASLKTEEGQTRSTPEYQHQIVAGIFLKVSTIHPNYHKIFPQRMYIASEMSYYLLYSPLWL